MQIADIYMSQRKLRRVGQLPGMRETLEAGGCLPRITLGRGPDGHVQVEDGHHRLVAVWMTGRRELRKDEYLLVEKETVRPVPRLNLFPRWMVIVQAQLPAGTTFTVNETSR